MRAEKELCYISLDLAAESFQKGSPGSFRGPAKLLGKHWTHTVRPGLEGAPCAPQAPEKACGHRRHGPLWYRALHSGSAVLSTRNTGTTTDPHLVPVLPFTAFPQQTAHMLEQIRASVLSVVISSKLCAFKCATKPNKPKLVLSPADPAESRRFEVHLLT